MKSWQELPDEQLIRLALAGQVAAYGELVRRYQVLVFNVAYRLVGDREEAADLSQEAFLRAYRSLATFDPARPFRPWVCRVVTNLTLNRLAQRQGQPALSLETGQRNFEGENLPLEIADDQAEPEKLLLAREQQQTIREALLALPPRYRVVIELRHFQELSYEEIAATLNLRLSDVKSNLYRARRMLREWLENKI